MSVSVLHREQWDWHGENYCIQKTSNFDITEEVWNDVPQNGEDLSYMFDGETTPVKACGDLAYNVDNGESSYRQKEVEEVRETSQAKRRRMLQFDSQDSDQSLPNMEMPSPYFKNAAMPIIVDDGNGFPGFFYACEKHGAYRPGKDDSIKDIFPEVSQWMSGAPEYTLENVPDLEANEAWLAEYLNDAEMQLSPDDLNFSGADDVHIDVAELCNITPSHEQNVVPQPVTRPSKNVVFKGRKSFIRTPTKLASTVAYPFAFIKPSGAHGDVTLKEINQRILNPTSKSKESSDDTSAYPKSAFSGKPVVGKTKIRTDGGKGSITIMRTKG
ncbi:protein XRI1-like [Trifolium pratense]|uniref:Protein XRI1-like n=1 Tax=Trifolium pratense TaxID=57577 RepID=A0A2K3PIL2_TRIPR|nr:protein XRI1-like [Trifolium pratense]